MCSEEEYTIPQEIIESIPKHFIPALIGELVGIFGREVFERDEDGTPKVFWMESTAGWQMAFHEACEKAGCLDLYRYWEKLEYYDSDYFDGEIGDRVIAAIEGNAWYKELYYYQYLCRKFQNS